MRLSIALVGCGAMGSALLKGWLTLSDTKARFANFWVIEPHREKVELFLKDPRVGWLTSSEQLPQTPDLIFFAVKPYHLADILPHYRVFNTLFISVVSGKPLSFYETYLSSSSSVVRAMPNIPLSIHQGVVAFLSKPSLSTQNKQRVETCFRDMGFSFWGNSDDDLDKITALTGSGPAYVFYMLEVFAQTAEALGFSKETSLQMAISTFEGASIYARQSGQSPENLRAQVTSPQGTTAEAIKVLERRDLYHLMEEAVKAAYKRAKELADEGKSV
ncbi:MAG: pyrroline-5-carboxylate reductase [Alphaproteobacteria bacterium]|nr:pyrroline-5-carboxylate reductase [Alphaproteobacteria bacterium]